MNNMPFPYMPYPYPMPFYNEGKQPNEDELVNIKNELKRLEQRIIALEKMNTTEKKVTNDYTKKEPGMYMM